MPYSPSQPLVLKAELQINGVWTTITSRTRAAGGLSVKHGRSDGATQGEPSLCEVTIGNDDAWLTEGNYFSPWYPYVGRGTPLRLSLTGILAADAPRFTGKIDTLELEFPAPGVCNARVTAIGLLGDLAQNNDALRSPLFRSTAGIAPGDFTPLAYWPLEDESGASRVASGLPGGPSVGASPLISFASDNTLAGSAALPSFASGARLVFPMPAYTDTGQWVIQMLVRIPSEPAANTAILDVKTTGTGDIARWQLTVEPGSPTNLRFNSYKADGSAGPAGALEPLDGSPTFRPTESAFFGHWWMLLLRSRQSGGTVFGNIGFADGGQFLGSFAGAGSAGIHSPIAEVSINIDANAAGIAIGHFAVFTDAAYSGSAAFNAKAMTGYVGEQAHIRVARLLTEEGIDSVIYGSVSAQMGPQRIAILTDLLADCERADQGLLADSVTSLAIAYRTARHLYLQTPRVAISSGGLTRDLKPVFDFQRTSNDWTVSRLGGSNAHASDEAHIARINRRMRQSIEANLASDDQLPHHARWRVALGTATGPRYSEGALNLRNPGGAAVADSLLAAIPGDRMTALAAALPSQHPPGGLDQLTTGWREDLDVDTWAFQPVLVPSQPYSSIGVWGLLAHVLHANISATTTSVDIATTDLGQPILKTSGLGSGYGITVGAEDMQVTAVADSAVAYGSVGTAAHANNASVSPGVPGSLAQNDLMIMLAAIRNSGAGVPDTPSGWYRFPVFPASSNVQLFGKIAGASESSPTVTFTGGVANADTSAQIIRLTGKWHDVTKILHSSASCLNTSAQDVVMPGLPKPDGIGYYLNLYVGWKQDDWTSVTNNAAATAISAPSTTTGDDQAFAWAYLTFSGTAFSTGPSQFTVTGGAAAISRGAVARFRCDYQTATVTRSVNGVSATHSASDAVTVTRPLRWEL